MQPVVHYRETTHSSAWSGEPDPEQRFFFIEDDDLMSGWIQRSSSVCFQAVVSRTPELKMLAK